MKVVLDTNVLLSAVFFSGVPYTVLDAWRQGKLTLVVSAEILDEYDRVSRRLSEKYPGVDAQRILELVKSGAELVAAPSLDEDVCKDPSDTMFFACAAASGCAIIISGDKHLHDADGYRGIKVLKPRDFVEQYLPET